MLSAVSDRLMFGKSGRVGLTLESSTAAGAIQRVILPRMQFMNP
jgi:hypothetical protein